MQAKTFSPFNDLPVEVIADVFYFLYRTLKIASHSGRKHPLEPLRLVCRQWSDVVMEVPALWSIIRIASRGSDGAWKRHVEVYLERSGNVPLHLIVEVGYPEEEALQLLERHRARWHRLTFLSVLIGPAEAPQKGLANPEPFLRAPVPELKSLEILGRGRFGMESATVTTTVLDVPKLETFTCTHYPITFKKGVPPPLTSFTIGWKDNDLFRQIPLSTVLLFRETLLELTIAGETGWDDSAYSTTPIHFPHLTHLKFENWKPLSCLFLERAQLPSLQHLQVQNGGSLVPATGFPTFDHLHTLVWEESAEREESAKVLKLLLNAAPNLLTLSTHNVADSKAMSLHRPPSSDVVAALVEKLPSGELKYCRRLRHLRINRAMLDQLDWLTEQRPLLETITLEAPYYGDYADYKGERCLVKAKAICLQKVERRVKLVTLSGL